MSEARDPASVPPRDVPGVYELTYGQYAGWCCVWCRRPLDGRRRPAGVSRGRDGEHVLDVQVYACPDCP